MLGLSKKTRGQRMREELGASWEHFLQAATYAANSLGSTVGPSTSKVRSLATRGWGTTTATIAPLAVAYRQGATDAQAAMLKLAKKNKRQKGRQMASRKTGMLVGFLVVGAAAGATGALVIRRRRKQQWADYEPSESYEAMSPEERAMLNKAGQKADTAMDKTADKLETAASSMRRTDVKAKADQAAEAGKSDELGSQYSSAKPSSRP